MTAKDTAVAAVSDSMSRISKVPPRTLNNCRDSISISNKMHMTAVNIIFNLEYPSTVITANVSDHAHKMSGRKPQM